MVNSTVATDGGPAPINNGVTERTPSTPVVPSPHAIAPSVGNRTRVVMPSAIIFTPPATGLINLNLKRPYTASPKPIVIILNGVRYSNGVTSELVTPGNNSDSFGSFGL